MNIIKKFILWVKLKIQAMIKLRNYVDREKEAKHGLVILKNKLLGGERELRDVTVLGVLYDYLIDEGNVSLSDDKNRLDFTIGSYSFFVNYSVNMTNDKVWFSLDTYETVKQQRRLLPYDKPKIEKVSGISILYDGNEYLLPPNAINFSWVKITEEYINRLIKYIEEIESKEY